MEKYNQRTAELLDPVWEREVYATPNGADPRGGMPLESDEDMVPAAVRAALPSWKRGR
jgi:hypothetical protein